MLPAVGLTLVLLAITTHSSNDYESVVMHCVKKSMALKGLLPTCTEWHLNF